MADDALRPLICLIEGDSSAFIVKPTGSMNIIELKKLIQEEGKNDVYAKDLILWKVDLAPPPINVRKNLIGKNVPGSMKLEEDFDNISAHWPATTPLNPQHLHIIVELPPDPSMSPLLSETHSAETCDLWPVVTIEATAEGDFGIQNQTEAAALD
ncbi:hypothetical protein BJV78DRAFT_32546 [Lactifluus subvellereus]|nr:hypothetical protein BJV78DRAFT_32546 [Lactifluus subvellereus]